MTAAHQLPAPFVLRFLEPAIAPIAGRPGQLLVVSPGHLTHTLATYNPVTRRVVRHLGAEADVSRAMALESAGVLEFLTPEDRERFSDLSFAKTRSGN